MTDAHPEAAKHGLLICSLGGTPEPVAAAIRHWRPARIMFLCSEQTRPSINTALDAAKRAALARVSPAHVLPISYHKLLADPSTHVEKVVDFLGLRVGMEQRRAAITLVEPQRRQF